MKSDNGRYILQEKGIYQDFYAGYNFPFEEKAIDIPIFNDGLSFFVKAKFKLI